MVSNQHVKWPIPLKCVSDVRKYALGEGGCHKCGLFSNKPLYGVHDQGVYQRLMDRECLPVPGPVDLIGQRERTADD